MAMRRGWGVHPAVMPFLGALALSGLIVLVSFQSSRTERSVLLVPGFQVPAQDEQLKGTPFMPATLTGGLPHPYSEEHPLGMVQYMPMDSMSWYPGQADAGEEGENPTEEEDAPAAEEGEEEGVEEPAAEATFRPTILKAMSEQGVADPVDFEHQKRFNTLSKSLKASPKQSGSRKIPDPVEWLTGHVMARKGQKQLAHSVQKVPTTKLHESTLVRRRLDRITMDGRFNMPTKATLKDAQERAKVLGCQGVHYLPGPGSTFTAAPCKSQGAEMKKLKGQRFTNRDDLGTTMAGASTDMGGTEFKNAYEGWDAADAADSSLLAAPHKSAPTPWEEAVKADDDLLQSRSQAQARHRAGAKSTKWHSW